MWMFPLLITYLVYSNCQIHDITFQYINNQIVVPVYVNDKGPYNFLFDTGIYPSMISEEIAKDNKIVHGKLTGSLLGFGNGSNPYAPATIGKISVGDATVQCLPTLVTSTRYIMGNFDIDGVLGYEYIKHFVTKINYRDCKIHISKEIILPESDNKFSTFPLKLAGGKIPVMDNIYLDGKAITVWLDTGCSGLLIVSRGTAEKTGLLNKIESGREVSAKGTKGLMTLDLVKVESISVGEFTQLKKKVLLFRSGGQNLLGNAFFDEYNLILDYIHGTIIIEE